ncbi:MAG: flagellar motor protein MotB [Aureliella sp.]
MKPSRQNPNRDWNRGHCSGASGTGQLSGDCLGNASTERGSCLHSVSRVHALFSIAILVAAVGCTRTPYPAGYPGGYAVPGQIPPGAVPPAGTVAAPPPGTVGSGPSSVYAAQQTAPQLVELQNRVRQLDDTNRQLTTQVAQAQQQVQAFRERSELLAKQLKDASEQNKQLLATTSRYANESLGMQASMQRMQESMQLRGGARLTANNSLANTMGSVATGLQIAGAQVIPEGNFLRIRLSSDQLFAPGTAQINPGATAALDRVAQVLVRQYPRQRVAVEGHTDAAAPMPGSYSTVYQLASSQAQAVLDHLVRRGGVPSQQLFIVAQGPNRPLADNQSPAGRSDNRRIEIVIQPETF